MKNAILLSAIGLTAVLAFSLFGPFADAAPSAQGGPYRGLVRAVVQKPSPTSGFTSTTTCSIINTSATRPITVGSVIILGPGGRSDVIAISNAHAGTVVEPFERYELVIDDNIPGVPAQTSANAYGVRGAVIEWTGGFPITVDLYSEHRPDIFQFGTANPPTLFPASEITP